MRSWNVHLKWTGVSHEHIAVKANTKEEAEAKIKKELESNEWSIFDHAWYDGVIELEDGYDESEVDIVSVKEK